MHKLDDNNHYHNRTFCSRILSIPTRSTIPERMSASEQSEGRLLHEVPLGEAVNVPEVKQENFSLPRDGICFSGDLQVLARLGDVGNCRSEEGRTEHRGQILQGHLVRLAHCSHSKNITGH